MKKIRVVFLTFLALIMTMQGLSASAATSVWEPVGNQGLSSGTADYESLVFCGDTPYLAYKDESQSSKAVLVKYDGTKWVNVGGAVSDNSADYISLAFNGDTPYVAYKDGASGGKVEVKKFDGKNWTYVGDPGSGNSPTCINLAFSGNTPYLAYIDDTSAAIKTFDGKDWGNVGTLGGINAAGLSFAFCSSTPYIAYQDLDKGSKPMVMKYESGNWVSTGPNVTNGVSKISLNISGSTLYLAFADSSDSGKATVMIYNNTTWKPYTGISNGAASYISLAFDGNTPYIAYTDSGSPNKGYVKKFNGTSWDAIGQEFSSTPAFNSLALNKGIPYVAFQDGSNSNKAAVKRYQTYYYGSIIINGTPGAVYQIKQGSTVVQDDITIPASGSVTKSNILVGNYSVIEKAPPSGYLANKPQEADITADGQTVTVKFVSYMPVTVTADKTDVTTYDGNDGVIQINASGGSGTFEYSIGANWQSNSVFSGLAGGIYQVKARDKAIPDNVSKVTSVEINQPGLNGTFIFTKLPSKVRISSAYQIALPSGYTNPKFTVSNSNLAAVTENGLVKFINRGTVKLTVKATFKGKQCTLSKKVTVMSPVKCITISYADLSITKGKLTAYITPVDASNKKVTWSSSNPKIASVSKTGIITAKSSGTVTITAKAQDGSGVVGVITINIVHSIQH